MRSIILNMIIILSSLAPLQRINAQSIDFAREVLPILSDNCFQCHGPDAKEGRKGDLRLDDETDSKKPRDGYQVILPGKANESELIKRIFSSDPDDQMPPPELGRTLSAQQKDILKRWINDGAEWGRHWAFERISRPEVPDALENPVDALIEKRLENEGIKINPMASRETLIRRVTLDLTGLSPTPEEVTDFLEDSESGAWERVVDRLLASQAYGERMAWDWLEAARYADTNGYQGDRERTMWPWRDWVVRAFNSNMPFDAFTTWQLAGDLLSNPTHDQILATGFSRNHMINGEGGRIPEENRVDYVFDMTETMGTVWLGLTLNCCRCHDHKFDPILQKEYFQLTAFFNQTPVSGGGGDGQTAPVLEVPTEKQTESIRLIHNEIAEWSAKISSTEESLIAQQPNWEEALLKVENESAWRVLTASKAQAQKQTLELKEGGFILAGGENAVNDEYIIEYDLAAEDISGFQIDAVRHPKMTAGRLARSDSGNFVLTDIQFSLQKAGSNSKNQLKIKQAYATFEQGDHKVNNTFDNNPTSGWAVWDGKGIQSNHAAVFALKENIKIEAGSKLFVELKFNSPHRHHNLGYFRIQSTSNPTPRLSEQKSDLLAALKVKKENRTTEQNKRIRDAFLSDNKELEDLRKSKQAAEKKLESIKRQTPKVMVMAERPSKRKTYILTRGLYNQPESEVQARLPHSITGNESSGDLNRLDLADWLVSRENPLMARVTVNRFWQMFFGIGLVKTAEDFGVQSEYPIHKDLLDWLSVELIGSGWDVKHLLKVIVTSNTYKRSSAIASRDQYEQDPGNRFLARGPRFRMPSWMIRDQALAASGLMNNQIGGAPVFSYQPNGVWSEATFGKKKYNQDKGAELHRRSLYTFWRRIVGPTMFFDTAKRQVCEVNPLRTNTPMHALTVFNDVTYVEAARSLAESILSSQQDSSARMNLAFRKILSREPQETELEILMNSLSKARSAFERNPESVKSFVSIGVHKTSDQLDEKELAAWTAVCLNILNLDETLTKE